jgi:hypothetical protein
MAASSFKETDTRVEHLDSRPPPPSDGKILVSEPSDDPHDPLVLRSPHFFFGMSI